MINTDIDTIKQKRKEWNRTYYNKGKEELKTKNALFYQENREMIKNRQRYYYYKKINNLQKLKKKYPDVYNMFVNINTI